MTALGSRTFEQEIIEIRPLRAGEVGADLAAACRTACGSCWQVLAKTARPSSREGLGAAGLGARGDSSRRL